MAASLADELAQTTGIFEVRIRRVTGSVLVHCSEGQTAEAILLAITSAVTQIQQQGEGGS